MKTQPAASNTGDISNRNGDPESNKSASNGMSMNDSYFQATMIR